MRRILSERILSIGGLMLENVPRFSPRPRTERVRDSIPASELYEIQKRAHRDGFHSGLYFGVLFTLLVTAAALAAYVDFMIHDSSSASTVLKRVHQVAAPSNPTRPGR
jgi:hypothetical protein